MKRITFVNGTQPALSAETLNALQTNIENAIQAVVEKQHPVNSIYMTLDETNPATTLGYGTWEQIKGRFLLGCGDNGDGINYLVGATSGIASHKHTTGGHTLTTSEIPSHGHTASSNNTGSHTHITSRRTSTYGAGAQSDWRCITAPASAKGDYTQDSSTESAGGHSHTITVNNTGGGGSHSHGDTGVTSNMPPYLAVYIWKRIA